MRRAAIVALGLSLAASADAQTRRPPPPAAAARPARPPPLVIEPHGPRQIVDLTGFLDGPVAIDGEGRVVYLSDDGILGQLAPDGNLRWAFLVGPPSGPAAIGPTGDVFVTGRDHTLRALDGEGVPRWTRKLGGRPVRGVAIGSEVIAVALASGVVEMWHPDGTPAGRTSLGGSPSAAPVMVGGREVVVPLRSGELVAAVPRRILWRARVSRGPVAPPAVAADGSLVAAGADGVVVRIAADGGIVWRASVGAAVRRSPAFAEDGTIYVAAEETLIALTGRGEIGWRARMPGRIVAAPLVADDGAIYVTHVQRGRGEVVTLRGDGSVSRRLELPSAPTRGMALSRRALWIALQDLTLRRFEVPQLGLARSGWPKARGNLANTGSTLTSAARPL